MTRSVTPPITPKQGGTGAALDAGGSAIPIYQVSPGYFRMDVPLNLLPSGYTWFAVEAVKGTYAADSGSIGIPGSAPAPVGVSSVRTSPRNPTTIDVSWGAVSGRSVNYKVYRLTSPTDPLSSGTLLGSTTATTYRDTGLAQATTYYYRVTVLAGGIESAPSDCASGKTFNAAAPVTYLAVPVILVPGQSLLAWAGHNAGTTFNVYGGGALLPNAIDSGNLVLATTLDPITGESAWQHTVSAPTEAYAAFLLSFGLTPVYGHYWITEVYPDGTESNKSEFIMFVYT